MKFYDAGKRIMDIVGSVIGIIIFSPVMLATAVFIKIVSPEGPILADIPKRVGVKGKKFRFLKFRSMIPNAHEWLLEHPKIHKQYKANDYKIAAERDPRLIKGAILMRKYSVDELPQFFNVFMGDMSIVGPRAYFPFELEEQVKRFPEAEEYIR